jgi:hypothetical protein
MFAAFFDAAELIYEIVVTTDVQEKYFDPDFDSEIGP